MKLKKLSARAFARAVSRGHGRALLHVTEYGDAGLEEIIDRALLKNTAYCMQIEGSRSSWLLRLVEATGHSRQYAHRFLESIKNRKDGDYDLVQQIEVAACLFELGFIEFRPATYRLFKALVSGGSSRTLCGCDVVDVGGLHGLKFVARSLGSASQSIDDYDCGVIMEHARETLGTEAIRTQLYKFSLEDVYIQNFLDACGRAEASRLAKPSTALNGSRWSSVPSLDELLIRIEREDVTLSPGQIRRAGRELSEEDGRKILQLLFRTRSEFKHLAYLRLFWRQPVPFVNDQLLALLDSSNRALVHVAASAMSHVREVNVRRKALQLLQGSNRSMIPVALELLRFNYLPEDSALILKSLMKLRSLEEIHSAGMELRDLAADSGGAELADCFLWLYEHGPDGFCRRAFVEQLLGWKKCPPEILFECQWDAYNELRQFARSLCSAEVEQPLYYALEEIVLEGCLS